MLGLYSEGDPKGSEVVLCHLSGIDGAHTMMTQKRQGDSCPPVPKEVTF